MTKLANEDVITVAKICYKYVLDTVEGGGIS